jgi:uncharacterized membrane protein HdeD (DUF308 family)
MALLGAYHGANPGMGWLFAVGLGLQERDRRAVLRALPPIALGHEAAIVLVAGLVIMLEVLTHTTILHVVAGGILVGFGIFRFVRPRWHPRWTRGRVSRGELTVWSFLMSSAHGAGLMVAPVLIGASASASAHDHDIQDMKLGMLSIPETALAIFLHVGAMLLVMGVIAVVVYDRFGTRLLRRTWLNLDAVWAAAFVVAGVVTFFS